MNKGAMMRAPISVVIPTLNAAGPLHGCLTALVEGIETGLIREVVVSDGGSSDDTRDLGDAWGVQVLSGPASRGGQLRRGCAEARGEWLLILHADTQLDPGWTSAVAAHLQTRKAGWFSLAFDQGGLTPRLVGGWANLRSGLGLPYGDQGLLIPRALYERIGGYADQPLMEDVDIVCRLGGHLVRVDAVARTSAAKYRSQGWLRRGSRNLWILARYWMGSSPEVLAQAYRR